MSGSEKGHKLHDDYGVKVLEDVTKTSYFNSSFYTKTFIYFGSFSLPGLSKF